MAIPWDSSIFMVIAVIDAAAVGGLGDSGGGCRSGSCEP